ncbi:methyl-accepting chemotaxis protein [Paenibacillus azoreducens]|uniref:Methyl-accepting chemotaxis protein n=1 Tax=Paenibacillus azoreducens TaxID=116718 RepID=A0A919YCW1_9BACL|nr:methyl-accepting chemotaxis protein [Paenibacillus azoreducens]GIO46470.1 methyl-accepting chemotaxis protein [Paenibacillus azoreducens]
MKPDKTTRLASFFRFKNLKTAIKIYILVGISLLLMASSSIFSYISIHQINQSSNTIYHHNLQAIIWLKQIQVNNRSMDTAIFESMMDLAAENYTNIVERIKSFEVDNDKLLQNYAAIITNNKEKELFNKYMELVKPYRQHLEAVEALAAQNKNDEAYALYNDKIRGIRLNLQNLLTELVEWNQELAQKEVDDAAAMAQSSLMRNIILGTISVLTSLIVGLITIKAIVNPLKDMQRLMMKAEQGDLTERGTYESKDEIGTLTKDFNQMIDGISTIMSTVNKQAQVLYENSNLVADHVKETAAASEQIAASMEQVAAGSRDQKTASKENAVALEELANGIEVIVDKATTATELSSHSSNTAQQGSIILDKAVKQMKAIYESVKLTGEDMKQLNESSEQVGQISDVIAEIANQTNLLSLNASIEAARAGESGRGFTVVAAEVRKLAEQTGDYANRIANLIKEVQSRMQQTTRSVELVQNDVLSGMEIVDKAGETFETIVESVQKVTFEMQETSASTEEMSAGTEEISASTEEMASIAEEASEAVQKVLAASETQLASVQTISASTEELRALSRDLQSIVKQFRLREQ